MVTPVEPAKYNAFRPITASAARINLKDPKELAQTARRLKNDAWQEDAWEYYDLVGEIKSTASLIAAILSRVRIYPALITDTSTVPSALSDIKDFDATVIEIAANAIETLASGNGGISGLLRDAGLNFFIAGECYLVQERKYAYGEVQDKWQIRSVSELIVEKTRNGESLSIKPRRDSLKEDYIQIHDGAFCGRMWRNHPRFSDEADSSIRGILDELEELLLANRDARMAARTRLPAGILAVPDDFDAVYQSDGDLYEEGEPETADLSDETHESFQEILQRALMAPISDENAAEGLTPTFIRGPREAIAAIRHITLERKLDPTALERTKEVLDRILNGLDVPKDVVTGLASVKYSNAVMIDESLYKAHIEPLLLMIVDQLTEVFYRPWLKSEGVDPKVIKKSVLWYDSSAITLKPSSAEAASDGFDKGILSEKAWRRSHGFPESDAPTQNEKAWRLAQDQGLISEPIMEALIKFNIPELYEMARAAEMKNTAPEDQEALSEAIGTETTEDTTTSPEETPTDLVEP
jgi:hypothetical protein